MRRIGNVALAWAMVVAGLTAGAAEKEEAYWLRKGDTVLFLGDSITAETKYFYKLYFDDIAKKYTDLIQGEKPKYDGKGWGTPALTFVNGGVSGDIAAGGLKRLPNLLAAHKPTACVVCFGMNDRYKDRANYAANLRAIVKALKAAQVRVTVLTSPCVYAGKNAGLAPFVKALAEMRDEAAKIAQEEGVLFADCYTSTAKLGETHDFTWGDGIHPNEEGHRAMADALQKAWHFGAPLQAGKPAEAAPAATPGSK
ncbi:MAG: hypothetical protein KIS92_26015 [Planctomycetota bacterium]|nr:hypothetical protein [Planctomycetota bacterium]